MFRRIIRRIKENPIVAYSIDKSQKEGCDVDLIINHKYDKKDWHQALPFTKEEARELIQEIESFLDD